MAVVLDASVVIAFLNPDDSLHDAAVDALERYAGEPLCIPASVYAEILIAPLRAGTEAVAAIDAFLEEFAVEILPIHTEIAAEAARLRSTVRGLRLPDAFVLASAVFEDADHLLTGDAAWASISDRVEVIGN